MTSLFMCVCVYTRVFVDHSAHTTWVGTIAEPVNVYRMSLVRAERAKTHRCYRLAQTLITINNSLCFNSDSQAQESNARESGITKTSF